MIYKIEYDINLDKILEKIPNRDAKSIKEKIEELAEDPKPYGSIKLSGRRGYRIRIGDYRVIYEIFDDKLIVLILNLSGRKNTYKKK